MQNSLSFRVKANVDVDKYRLLELFFRDWVDTTCHNEVHYKIESIPSSAWVDGRGAVFSKNLPTYETFRVDFDKQEDALAIMLKGVPEEFQRYLEILH